MNQGVIRVYSESPYEHLDPTTTEWLNHLKQMWQLWKRNPAISDMLFQFFSTSQNPYTSALQLMVSSCEFYSGRQNSLAYHIMETFSHWLECQNFIQTLPRFLKVDAINLVIKQRNMALVKLVIDTYRISEHEEILVETVKQLARSERYKEACQLASILELHNSFGIEEFIVPLIFQDKYVVAVQFLEGSKKHQIDLAVFLDNLIGKKSVGNEVQSIIFYLKIANARLNCLNYKALSKLLARIIKTFNLPPTTCPNLTQNRGKGVLQFLMHKRYIEKSIGGESWAEMVLEAIGDDETLQVQLIENVASHGDLKEALAWAKRFGIPKSSWPIKLQKFSRREENQSGSPPEENWEEENWDEVTEAAPALKFHKLPLKESQIKLIDTESSLCEFLTDLSNGVSMVGIDAEWKPSFGFQKCNLALIQVATQDVVYILDVISLAHRAPQALWVRLGSVLFENPKVLKLGFGINTDLVIVRETFRKLHGIKTGADAAVLDLGVLWKTLVNDYKFVFPFALTSRTSENLSSLIEMCLGESLDKSDQFSNWENRPLRKSQVEYAALDAYCLLEAYNVIVKEAESQNIPIADVIDQVMYEAVAKKSTATKKKKGGQSGQLSSRIRN